MIYRIDGTPPGQTGKLDSSRSSTQRSQDNGLSDIASAPSTPAADAPLMSQTRTAISASDGIDRQKVEAIKNAIRNGEFAVDAKRVAAAFIDLEMMTVR